MHNTNQPNEMKDSEMLCGAQGNDQWLLHHKGQHFIPEVMQSIVDIQILIIRDVSNQNKNCLSKLRHI